MTDSIHLFVFCCSVQTLTSQFLLIASARAPVIEDMQLLYSNITLLVPYAYLYRPVDMTSGQACTQINTLRTEHTEENQHLLSDAGKKKQRMPAYRLDSFACNNYSCECPARYPFVSFIQY